MSKKTYYVMNAIIAAVSLVWVFGANNGLSTGMQWITAALPITCLCAISLHFSLKKH